MVLGGRSVAGVVPVRLLHVQQVRLRVDALAVIDAHRTGPGTARLIQGGHVQDRVEEGRLLRGPFVCLFVFFSIVWRDVFHFFVVGFVHFLGVGDVLVVGVVQMMSHTHTRARGCKCGGFRCDFVWFTVV